MIGAAAALHSQTIALVRGPRGRRVIWDIQRERLETEVATADDTGPRDRSTHHT